MKYRITPAPYIGIGYHVVEVYDSQKQDYKARFTGRSYGECQRFIDRQFVSPEKTKKAIRVLTLKLQDAAYYQQFYMDSNRALMDEHHKSYRKYLKRVLAIKHGINKLLEKL